MGLSKSAPFSPGVSLALYVSTGASCNGESNTRKLDENAWEEKTIDGKRILTVKNAELNPEGESWRYTHLQVFTENSEGKSKYCGSTSFTDWGKLPTEEL